MGINLSSLLQEIREEYNLLALVHNGRVYIEIQKGIYGFPKAGILTANILQ
jgi:hypothetical protein